MFITLDGKLHTHCAECGRKYREPSIYVYGPKCGKRVWERLMTVEGDEE